MGPVGPVEVFEIVDLERETQAAVSWRWFKTINDTDICGLFEKTYHGFGLRIEAVGSRQEYVELMPVPLRWLQA